jgi:hypothetical protein
MNGLTPVGVASFAHLDSQQTRLYGLNGSAASQDVYLGQDSATNPAKFAIGYDGGTTLSSDVNFAVAGDVYVRQEAVGLEHIQWENMQSDIAVAYEDIVSGDPTWEFWSDRHCKALSLDGDGRLVLVDVCATVNVAGANAGGYYWYTGPWSVCPSNAGICNRDNTQCDVTNPLSDCFGSSMTNADLQNFCATNTSRTACMAHQMVPLGGPEPLLMSCSGTSCNTSNVCNRDKQYQSRSVQCLDSTNNPVAPSNCAPNPSPSISKICPGAL